VAEVVEAYPWQLSSLQQRCERAQSQVGDAIRSTKSSSSALGLSPASSVRIRSKRAEMASSIKGLPAEMVSIRIA
jgi:hypothetical protein